MKKLGISQRVENIPSYSERRDCLDQRWASLALAMNFMPVPLLNMEAAVVAELLDTLQLDAIILSGGNSLSKLDAEAVDIAVERDMFESALIEQAIQRGIPVVGVCRGMQMLNVFFGGGLTAVSGHSGVRHALQCESDFTNRIPEEINSFHNWTITEAQLAAPLKAIARDQQGNIEAFVHKEYQVAGIMWHPERESPFNQQDIDLLQDFLL